MRWPQRDADVRRSLVKSGQLKTVLALMRDSGGPGFLKLCFCMAAALATLVLDEEVMAMVRQRGEAPLMFSACMQLLLQTLEVRCLPCRLHSCPFTSISGTPRSIAIDHIHCTPRLLLSLEISHPRHREWVVMHPLSPPPPPPPPKPNGRLASILGCNCGNKNRIY